MSLPLLGLIGGHVDSTAITPLVVALRTWCRPHALDRSLGAPAAILATSPVAIGLDAALRGPLPVGIVCEHRSELSDAARNEATAIIVRDPGVAAEIGDRAVVWPRDAVAAAEHPYLSPFVRERWRRRLGLPSSMVIAIGSTEADPIPTADALASLALGAAAVVRGPLLVAALALGTPTVTDAATAARIGAEHMVHLAVATPTEARGQADRLATDPARATAVGWGGRRLVDTELDLGRVAFATIAALGIGPIEFPTAPLGR
ncbi:MAG: hypothetical protein ABJC79_10855, partial [Acidimicrobiia bacterium]